jgi:putative peptidoglycan lipid II flippase
LQVRIRIPPSPALGASSLVAVGILVSRLTGLVRERVIGYYFGVSIVADAFRAAIRIPNLLNNLFGEGVLSAAFVTVYAKLRALGEDEEAEDLASSVFAILSLVCAALVLLGILLTPFLIDVIAGGYKAEARVLTIRLVRILFPATGLGVMSAWCLGVLNSHRKFLLSYLAPVALNVTVIVIAMVAGKDAAGEKLVIEIAWAWVLGSALTFLLQLPKVLTLLPHFRPALDWHSPHVRTVLRNFGPVFLSRGVVQISAYVDQTIASWLPAGAMSAMGYAQVIAVLPISLFSMSVSAAELPTLSSATGSQAEVAEFLRNRLSAGLRRIAFFIVPSAVAFLLLGDVLAAALYQTGRFNHADSNYVWAILAGSAVGLLASALGRLYSSTFYALLDTRTPLRFALVRIALTTILGLVCALLLPGWLGIEPHWGVAGLTASAGIAGWAEFALLRSALAKRIGPVSLAAGFAARLWAVAFVAAVLAYGIKLAMGVSAARHPILLAGIVLPFYGLAYFAGTAQLGITESRNTIARFTRRLF